jgi:hypothetical protein
VVTRHWGKEKKQDRVGEIALLKYSEEQVDPVFFSAVVCEDYRIYMHYDNQSRNVCTFKKMKR